MASAATVAYGLAVSASVTVAVPSDTTTWPVFARLLVDTAEEYTPVTAGVTVQSGSVAVFPSNVNDIMSDVDVAPENIPSAASTEYTLAT